MTQTLYSDGEEGGSVAVRTAQKTLPSQSLVVSDSRRHVATRRGVESLAGDAVKKWSRLAGLKPAGVLRRAARDGLEPVEPGRPQTIGWLEVDGFGNKIVRTVEAWTDWPKAGEVLVVKSAFPP